MRTQPRTPLQPRNPPPLLLLRSLWTNPSNSRPLLEMRKCPKTVQSYLHLWTSIPRTSCRLLLTGHMRRRIPLTPRICRSLLSTWHLYSVTLDHWVRSEKPGRYRLQISPPLSTRLTSSPFFAVTFTPTATCGCRHVGSASNIGPLSTRPFLCLFSFARLLLRTDATSDTLRFLFDVGSSPGPCASLTASHTRD